MHEAKSVNYLRSMLPFCRTAYIPLRFYLLSHRYQHGVAIFGCPFAVIQLFQWLPIPNHILQYSIWPYKLWKQKTPAWLARPFLNNPIPPMANHARIVKFCTVEDSLFYTSFGDEL